MTLDLSSMNTTSMEEVNNTRQSVVNLVHNVQNYSILNLLYHNPYLESGKFLEMIRFILIAREPKFDLAGFYKDHGMGSEREFIAHVVEVYKSEPKKKFLEAKAICLEIYNNIKPYTTVLTDEYPYRCKSDESLVEFFNNSKIVQNTLELLRAREGGPDYQKLLRSFWLEKIHYKRNADRNGYVLVPDFINVTQTTLFYNRNFGSIKAIFDMFFGDKLAYSPNEERRNQIKRAEEQWLKINFEILSQAQSFILEWEIGISANTSLFLPELISAFIQLDNTY